MAEIEQADMPSKGLIGESLGRNNAQIRQERGTEIYEDLEMEFKRVAEDAKRKVTRLERNRKAMYDFSPTNSQSLVMSADLKPAEIAEKEAAIKLAIRNAKIELELAIESYQELIGQPLAL